MTRYHLLPGRPWFISVARVFCIVWNSYYRFFLWKKMFREELTNMLIFAFEYTWCWNVQCSSCALVVPQQQSRRESEGHTQPEMYETLHSVRQKGIRKKQVWAGSQWLNTSLGIIRLSTLLELNCCFNSLPVHEPTFSRILSSSYICTCEALYNSSKALVSFTCPSTELWNLDSSAKWEKMSTPRLHQDSD